VTSYRGSDGKFHSDNPVTHLAEYHTWKGMKQRCSNPKDKRYGSYGARGIIVCERWAKSFDMFYKDMGPRPEGMSLDRINVHGHYVPGNVRWASATEQARNKTTTVYLTWEGQTKSLASWAELCGIKYDALYGRVRRGWSVEKTLKEFLNG